MSAGQDNNGEDAGVGKKDEEVTAPQTDVVAVAAPDAGPSAEVSRKRQSLSDLFTIVSLSCPLSRPYAVSVFSEKRPTDDATGYTSLRAASL